MQNSTYHLNKAQAPWSQCKTPLVIISTRQSLPSHTSSAMSSNWISASLCITVFCLHHYPTTHLDEDSLANAAWKRDDLFVEAVQLFQGKLGNILPFKGLAIPEQTKTMSKTEHKWHKRCKRNVIFVSHGAGVQQTVNVCIWQISATKVALQTNTCKLKNLH